MATWQTLARFDSRWRKSHGVELVGGVDEAGRGALAGPVVAACVVLAPGARLRGVNDSKQLEPEQREAMVPVILEQATAWGVGWASAAEVDAINILQATLRAAGRAMDRLTCAPQLLLTDYLKLPGPPCPCEPLVGGDGKSQAIAAASVLAKVARDRIMRALDGEYPEYGFASHKGYGTRTHWTALDAHGPTTLHRLTFRGVCPEPFFGAEQELARPRRRCRSHVRCAPGACASEALPPPAACPDWHQVLTAPPESLAPHAFLPELEWQLALDAADAARP